MGTCGLTRPQTTCTLDAMRSNRAQYGADSIIVTSSLDRQWAREREALRVVTNLRVAWLVWLGDWHFPR